MISAATTSARHRIAVRGRGASAGLAAATSCLLLAGALFGAAAAAADGAAEGASAEGAWAEGASAKGEPLGRVVALRGEVYATAPDGSVRALECQAPILVGDQISTGEGEGLGVLSGDFYARLGEQSELRIARTRAGTPHLDLGQGHLRLLDAGAEGAPVGRIVTPGLAAREASRDTEALVLKEKISLVSMICGWDGGLDVTRVGAPDEASHPASGQCAIAKPREPIYTARASHDKLPIMDDAACPALDALALVGVGDHFTPYDVAGMLPPVDAAGPIVMPNVLPPTVAQREPCTVGVPCGISYSPTVTIPPVILPPPFGLP